MSDIRTEIVEYLKGNYLYNSRKFLKEKLNLIVICGYAGSGKTTISNYLKSKYNLTVIHLDDLTQIAKFNSLKEIKEKDKIIFEFFINHTKLYKHLKSITYNYVYDKLYSEFMSFVLSRKYTEEIVVIEGVKTIQPFLEQDEPEYFNKVLNIQLIKDTSLFVITRTSKLVSSIRGAFRNVKLYGKNKNKIIEWFYQFKRLICYKDLSFKIDKFKQFLKDGEEND